MSNLVPILGVNRHRLLIDGEGVTTLVAFHGCPLHCKYCLNPQSLSDDFDFPLYSCEQLYERVKVDELYFLATRGGYLRHQPQKGFPYRLHCHAGAQHALHPRLQCLG